MTQEGFSAQIVVLLAGVVVAVGLTACSSEEPSSTQNSGVNIGEVVNYTGLTREHTEDDVDYPQRPPVGGNHDPAWLDCNGVVYDEPVRDENAVHSLEHGAVWITYQPDVAQKDVEQLKAKVEGEPYTFMSPYPEQPAPIMATAWGVQLALDDGSDPALNDFLEKYRQGAQTPEPGATCDGGVML